MLAFAWLALHTCSLFPLQGWRVEGASGAWESGNRVSFEQSTIWACVSRENTRALLEGPLSSWCHLEKGNTNAHMGFSEAGGLDLEGQCWLGMKWEWAQVPGAPSLCLPLSPYPAEGPIPSAVAVPETAGQLSSCKWWQENGCQHATPKQAGHGFYFWDAA